MSKNADSSARRKEATTPDLSAIDDWIFDLDNTLYPQSSQLFSQIDLRILSFIQDFLQLKQDQARRLQRRYYLDHGSSLRGLMLHHGLAPDRFLDFVHDIDLTVLAPAPQLDGALTRLPGRKLIYTNGSTRHAEGVLARLGIGHHFAEIYDIRAADFRPKPQPESFDGLIGRHAITPSTAIFFEDIERNLVPAAALGLTTVWVRPGDGAAAPAPDHVDHVVEDLAAWLAALGED